MEPNPTLVDIDDNSPANSAPRRKHWCFTLFYTEEGSDCILPTELPSCCTYLVFQRESCPDTGRTHVQGFIAFSLAVRFTRAKQHLQSIYRTGNSPRIQYIRGSVDDNIRYCTKSESRLVGTQPVELGDRPVSRGKTEKGRSTQRARELILAGKSALQTLADEDCQEAWSIALRSSRAWDSLVAQLSTHRDPMVPPTVILFYGPSRVGKTKLAWEMYTGAYFKPSGKWWPEYTNQSVAIYDDFDGSDMCFGDWKTLFDRYPRFVEKKGGDSKCAVTTHIITTNVWPSHWWTKRVTGRYGRDAIWGRITQVWDFHTRLPTVWDGEDQVSIYRQLAEHWALEDADPKARPE